MMKEVTLEITIETENMRLVDRWLLQHMIDDTVRKFASVVGLNEKESEEE